VKGWLETRQVYAALATACAPGRRAALATVIRVRGSAYRHPGAKLVVFEDDTHVGNVSGGCLEGDVREVARQVLATGVSERRSYCGGADEIAAWDLGVGCEGEVELLIEPLAEARVTMQAALAAEAPFVTVTTMAAHRVTGFAVVTGTAADALRASGTRLEDDGAIARFIEVHEPAPRLVIVSAGDDAIPLARLGELVGFRVTVVDRRPGLLTAARFPDPIRRLEATADALGARLALDADDAAVVMTHHFGDDTDYLDALRASPARYLGLLGPRQRTDRIVARLEATGPFDRTRLFGPVGLDIGTDGAEQVALAVIAEILAVRSGRAPRSLRDRVAPIHADVG